MCEFECPNCDRAFDTRRGLGVHHSHVHGKRLPNRECGNCGGRFYSDYAKEYCSEECHRAAVSFAGSDNPNYRGGKTTSDCDHCGETFEYHPSDKEGLYCSECVRDEEWRDPPSLESSDNPRWSGGTVQLECDVCGDRFERYPGNVGSDVTVCSDDCRAEWLSDAFSGEGHPNWKGGNNPNYGKGWNEVRRKALERDDHRCIVCGTTREELGRNPDVHHIRPVRAFAESEHHEVEDAHDLDNVVSLCIGCHRKAEFGKIGRDELRSLMTTD